MNDGVWMLFCVFDETCRVASPYLAWGNVLHHHTACCHDGAVANADALSDEAPGADEHVAADAHGSRLLVADVQPSVLAVLPAGGVEVSVEYFGPSSDVHVVADGDAVVAVDAGVADAGTIADGERGAFGHDDHGVDAGIDARSTSVADERAADAHVGFLADVQQCAPVQSDVVLKPHALALKVAFERSLVPQVSQLPERCCHRLVNQIDDGIHRLMVCSAETVTFLLIVGSINYVEFDIIK